MVDKLIYPSASRNCDVIISCLDKILPQRGKVLEIASGSGQHISALANKYKDISWRPSDPDGMARASIDAWRGDENGDNLLAALDIDVMVNEWWQRIDQPLAGMMAINMIHIAPWQAALGLLTGAGAALAEGGFLYLYGPFMIDGTHTAPSNEAFDKSLRFRNPDWGVRDKSDVVRAAAAHGLQLEDMIAMPANNFSLIFRKA